jgi:hypothetical protein
VAQDPQFRQQLEQRYSELAYEPHEAWFARLGQREAEYRRLWQTTPWNR